MYTARQYIDNKGIAETAAACRVAKVTVYRWRKFGIPEKNRAAFAECMGITVDHAKKLMNDIDIQSGAISIDTAREIVLRWNGGEEKELMGNIAHELHQSYLAGVAHGKQDAQRSEAE